VFLVDELAPECRFAGLFTVRAHRGRNVVRFDGRIKGRRLDPGTYRLTAHSRGADARRLVGVTVAVLGRPAPRRVVKTALTRNTCPSGALPSTIEYAGFAFGKGGEGTQSPRGRVGGVQATAAGRRPYEDQSGGRLRAVTGPVAGALESIDDAARSVPPVLIALAALAVLLLGIASLPQPLRTSRTGAALVHHRATIALAGVGVLVGTAISFVVL
jgi:hypothetical protein